MPPQHQFQAKDIIGKGLTSLEAVENLEEWLRLMNMPQMTKEQLVLFLLSCDNDIKLSKITIKAYLDCKNDGPELFDDRDMEAVDLKQVTKTADVSVFPVRTNENHAIIFGRLKDTTYSNFVLESCIKLLFMCLEAPLYDNPPAALIVIFDMKGIGLMHLTRVKLGAVKKFFHYVQEAMPCKLKEIHILNVVYFFDKIMTLIKPFMKEELINMLHLHPTGMEMHEFFDKYLSVECMPEDYGGTLPCQAMLSKDTYQKLAAMKDFFLEEDLQRKLYRPEST